MNSGMRLRLVGHDVWQEHDIHGRRSHGPAVAENLLGVAVDGCQLRAVRISREKWDGLLHSRQLDHMRFEYVSYSLSTPSPRDHINRNMSCSLP